MHQKKLVTRGKPIEGSSKVLLMLHGRGADAEDILGLAQYLLVQDFTLIAPSATNNTWYPLSFMARPQENEPWLSSALGLLKEIVADLQGRGIAKKNIFLLGFSQGACLSLEFAARNADTYGGVIAFTGGLIGDKIYRENYQSDFGGTPVFIGTSDPDPHVPVQRVDETVKILEEMNARVVKKIYPNMGHTINQDEIDTVNEMFFNRNNKQSARN